MDRVRPLSLYTEDGDDEPQDFPTVDVEAAHFKSKYIELESRYSEIYQTLQDTKAELDDFQASSKELEEELERELASTEATQDELRSKLVKLETDKEDWKTKYLAAQKAHNLALGTLQRELDSTKAEKERLRINLRDLEMGVDDLERNERMVSSSLQDVESRYNRAIEEKTMLEQELISKQQVEEESQRLKDEIRDLQTEVSVLKQTRPRIPSSNHLPPPQPHMPSLLESSQELSMSDLEPNATFLSNSNPTSSSANEPTLSPTITIRQSLEAPTSPSPGQTSFPSSSGVVRSASSPVVSRIPPSPSRLPMMTSPSRLPKSTTYAKNLASFALDSPVAGGGPSSPLARPRQPPSKANIQSSSNARTAPHVPDSRSKGVRMVSDLGERVRTLQSRIQTQTIPRSRRVHLPLVDSPVSTTSRPTPAAAHPRTRALASASGSGLKSPGRALSVAAAAGAGGEGTPGTPGDSWVMVPEHDGPLSPSPTLSSEHADSRLSRGISRSKSSNGTTVPPLRQSSSQKPPSISTRALPSRPGIPSPLSTAPTPAYYASTSTSRPPSRISTLSRSTNASSHSRPTTPTFLNMPSLPSSSMPQRSTSPLPSMDGSSGVKFPSRSNSPAFGLGGTAGSTSSRLPSISRPKVLGHHQSYKSTHPSTPSASSSSSGASELARPSRRRTSLTASSINGNGNGSSHLPAPSSSSTTRGTAPRISFGSSSSSSRPVSAPVPPHSPAPPVPVIPSHLRKPSNGLGIAGKGMKMMGRKRSATGGAEGKLI